MMSLSIGGLLAALALGLGPTLSSAELPGDPDAERVDIPIISTANGHRIETDGLVVDVPELSEDSELATQVESRAAAILCTITVDNPHSSAHVAGTINVVSKVKCTSAVALIELQTSLNRNTPTFKTWGAFADARSKAALNGNAAAPCSAGPGTFQGWGRATIVPPAGYTLAAGSATPSQWGITLSLACGVRLTAAEEGLASEVTLRFDRN